MMRSIYRGLILCILSLVFVVSASCQFVSPTETPTTTAFPMDTAVPTSTQVQETATPEAVTTKEPKVQGTVTLWLDWTQDELEVLYPILIQFQENFPEVELSVSYYTPEELKERFEVAVEAGEAPTMILGPTEWGLEWFSEGMIQEITDRISSELVDALRPVAWEEVTTWRRIFGLPLTMEGIVLYRNQELVNESPETYAEFIRRAKALTIGSKVGLLRDVGFIYSGAFMRACGGELFTIDGSLGLTEDAGVCWLELMKDLGRAGPGTMNTDVDLIEFEEGRAGWLVDGTWNSDRLMLALGEEKLAIDPWPIYSATGERLSGFAWTRNMYFSTTSSSEDFNAAWVLALFLLTPDVQSRFLQASSGCQVPVAISITFEKDWQNQMMTAIRGNIALPIHPQYEELVELLQQTAYGVSFKGDDPAYAFWILYPKLERKVEASDSE